MKRKGRKRIEGKSPAPGGNRTLDLTITDLSTNMQGIRSTIPLSLEIQFFLFEIETGTGPVIFFGIHATGNLLRKLRRGLFSETKKNETLRKKIANKENVGGGGPDRSDSGFGVKMNRKKTKKNGRRKSRQTKT